MITDPHLPAPQSLDDCIELFKIAGLQCLKPGFAWLEANGSNGHPLLVRISHYMIDKGGYELEQALGLPDGSLGAGGTGKPW